MIRDLFSGDRPLFATAGMTEDKTVALSKLLVPSISMLNELMVTFRVEEWDPQYLAKGLIYELIFACL